MTKLIRELIDATYDTGHYAGDGRSGTDLHKGRIKDREALRDKLEIRLTAADALLAASKDSAKFVAKYVADTELVIGKRALDRLEKAIREYEEARNGS